MTRLMTLAELAADEPGTSVRDLRAALGEVRTDIDGNELERRTETILKLGLPGLHEMADLYRGQRALICGSGPSANADYVSERQASGARVFAVNTSHDWLIERGVTPDFAVMLDPNRRCADYMTPNRRVTYILSTGCDKATWIRFLSLGIRPLSFVPIMTDTNAETIAAAYPGRDICLIAGGTTVGMRTVHVCGWMGFQEIELHGFDSCYAPGFDGSTKTGLYAKDKPSTYHDAREITLASQKTGECFTCISNGAMARQIISFQALNTQLPDAEVHGRVGQIRILVSGDGAIPWMAWKDGGPDKFIEHTDPAAMLAKYGDAKHWDYCKGEARDADI